jgi:hypothetical protein
MWTSLGRSDAQVEPPRDRGSPTGRTARFASMALRRIVSFCGWIAPLFALLGFAASIGHGILPTLPSALVLPLALLLAAGGAATAWIGHRRGVEIDQERFAFVEDPHATRDERKLAHQEAERQHRLSMTALAAAPLALGYWLAYQLPRALRWAPALPAAALIGFAAVLVTLHLRGR